MLPTSYLDLKIDTYITHMIVSLSSQKSPFYNFLHEIDQIGNTDMKCHITYFESGSTKSATVTALKIEQAK